LFAKKIGRKLIDEGVADWNERKLVEGRKSQLFMAKIEKSKERGDFTPPLPPSLQIESLVR
jgi:hypothetical protein